MSLLKPASNSTNVAFSCTYKKNNKNLSRLSVIHANEFAIFIHFSSRRKRSAHKGIAHETSLQWMQNADN